MYWVTISCSSISLGSHLVSFSFLNIWVPAKDIVEKTFFLILNNVSGVEPIQIPVLG